MNTYKKTRVAFTVKAEIYEKFLKKYSRNLCNKFIENCLDMALKSRQDFDAIYFGDYPFRLDTIGD